MNWYLAALNKYAVSSGRARRKEYWMFTLVNGIIIVVLTVADTIFDTQRLTGIQDILYYLYGLAVALPTLTVWVRRLHDIDRSGWWIFILFVPLAGAIVLLIFACKDGTPGSNRFGANPKEEAA